MERSAKLPNWTERQQEIARLAERQLFFIGGAPRSGTTWLQHILDCHPDVSCRGEGLFLKHLAAPLDSLMAQRCRELEAKNITIFQHSGGYPLPAADDTEFLLRTAILLALRRQNAGKACLAIGEKTPENVFFFPRLKALFPGAKLICIARDPRDVLTSAWHFFQKTAEQDDIAAKMAFIQIALPSLAEGARSMIALAERYCADCMIVTYEALRETPEPIVAKLFRFLAVSARDEIVADCIKKTSFASLTGGRAAGVEHRGAFFRRGVIGDWASTLTPEMNEMILKELGWMFPYFRWPTHPGDQSSAMSFAHDPA
jgi:Sulfotransferase family